MPNSVDVKSKFLGAMISSALGDAIGELASSYVREADLCAKIAQTDPLVYTDDTAMAVGLAESLTRVGRLDLQHLGDTFRANFVREPWRGYATGPPTIFSMVERYGTSYAGAASSLFGGQGSFGNGAAMRITPVALVFHDRADLYQKARASASVTHAHPIGLDGAAVLVRAVAQAVKLDPQEPFPLEGFCRGLADFAQTKEIRSRMELDAASLFDSLCRSG